MAAMVTLYGVDGCPHCDAVRARLVANGTAFSEVDLRRHPEVVPELLKLTKGRRVVPVLVEGARISVAPDGGSEF
jgi:glutaredoxin